MAKVTVHFDDGSWVYADVTDDVAYDLALMDDYDWRYGGSN